jgi:hypothetical protein
MVFSYKNMRQKFAKNNYLFNNKKGKLFHTNFIFRVGHTDGSSGVHHGWRGWGARVMRHLYDPLGK